MKTMILTASTGGGHNRASNALKSYINTHDPESDVRIIDAIEECSSVLNFTVVKGYKALVTLTPSLFGKIYKNSDKKSPLSDTVTFLYQQCAKRLKPVIDEYMPDVIISCHPFAGAILGYMKEQFGYTMPLISIVTDFLPHRTYIANGINAYVTASAQAKEILSTEYEIESDRIFDYGHPIFDRFYEGNGRTREDVTDILEIYENLLTIDADYQIIVITGRNQKLYDAFDKLLHDEDEIVTDEEPEFLSWFGEDSILRYMYDQSEQVIDILTRTFRHTIENRKPTKLFFFIDNVDDYMHVSDLIVTKPGGLTTSESIAAALPMVVFKAYPGQEEQNAALLVENNIGVIMESSETAAQTVGDLLKSDTKLDEMRESCRRFVHKDSCRRIYELAKNLVENKE